MAQIVTNGFCSASVICLVALGFGMIYWTTGVLHVAHAAVFTLGAYVAYLATNPFHLSPLISALFATAAASVLGVLIEVGVYAPLVKRKASGNVIFVSSLGIYIAIVNFIALVFGNQTKILSPGVGRTIDLGSVILTYIQLAQLVIALAIVVVVYSLLHFSHFGRLCRAMSDNSALASVLGIDVPRTRVLVTVCGSALAGLAGCIASLASGTQPTAGFPILLAAVVACIIGGFGSFIAPALGALIIGLLGSLTTWYFSAEWSSASTFALLILFMLVRPQGIWGNRRRISEL